MARMSATEKREKQEQNFLLDSFLRLRTEVNLIAERKVVEYNDLWSNASLSKDMQYLISEAYDVANKRKDVQNTMSNIAERLNDDVKRMNKGRESDDITRNSSFTNLSADIAVFNHRLREIHRRQDRAQVFVWELFPHLTKNELEEYVANASELFARMSAQVVSEITGEIVAAFRAELFAITKEIR